MTSLCIQDLVNVTGGTLRMGMMPPLGGTMAPIGRLVREKNQIQMGDAVFATVGGTTSGTDAQSSHKCANELFFLGACGVISEESVCPWDGKFSLQVHDTTESQTNLFRFVRNRLFSPVVAVLDDRVDSPVARVLRNHFGCVSHDPYAVGSVESLSWQVLGAPPTADAIVAQVAIVETDATLSLLRPNVVVAAASIPAAEISRAIGLADKNGILVLEENGNASTDDCFDRKSLPDTWQIVNATGLRSEESVSGSMNKMTTIAQVAISAINRQLRQIDATTESQSRVA